MKYWLTEADTQRRLLGLTQLRIRVLSAFLLFLSVVLLVKLFSLQIMRSEHFQTLSTDNHIKVMPLLPPRGQIYSSDGVLLAGNVSSYRLMLDIDYVRSLDDLERSAQRVFPDLQLTEAIAAGRRKGNHLIVIKEGLNEKEIARFAVNQPFLPGMIIEEGARRYYPLREIAMHVVGYVSGVEERDLRNDGTVDFYRAIGRIGRHGVEQTYERKLRGVAGLRHVEVNAEGKILREVDNMPAHKGDDLHLTINAAMQIDAYHALADSRGAIVAMEPDTGKVRVLVSAPAWDPNLFSAGLSTREFSHLSRRGNNATLFNRAVAGQYPPGSTIKPFVALAGMKWNVPITEEGISCHGSFALPNGAHVYRDWKRGGHGLVDIVSAVEESCDVFFYRLSLALGVDRLSEFLHLFGFGRSSGIDLPGEKSGLVPSADWKRKRRGDRWYAGDTVVYGIGQGYLLTTPLQLTRATAALATRGRLVRPRVLEVDENYPAGTHALGKRTALMSLPDQAWDLMAKGMEAVVHGEKGTARAQKKLVDFRMAGKTGTAQVIRMSDEETDVELINEQHKDHGLFIAYAPAQNPLIVITVIVENGGSGSSSAAPIAVRLASTYMKLRQKNHLLAGASDE